TETFTAYFHDASNPQSISDSNVKAIYEDSRGMLWIGTTNGLNIFNRETETFTAYFHDASNPQSISNNCIASICEDAFGYLWVGTKVGLNRFNVESKIFYNYKNDTSIPSSVINNRIMTLYIDAEGILWAGTISGISKLNFNKQAFRYYSGVLNDNIMGIISIDSGTLWLEIWQGVLKFNSEEHVVETAWADIFIDQNYNSSTMNTFCIAEDGSMWVGTDNSGLQRFDPATNKLTVYTCEPNDENSLSSNTILSVYANHDGIIWVGTTGGLCSFNPETEEFCRYKNNPEHQYGIQNENVWITYETSDQELLFGTDSSVYKLDEATGEVLKIIDGSEFIHSPYNTKISTMYEDSNGLLWLGTNHGLYCYNLEKDEFVAYGVEEALADRLIQSIIEDDNGKFWVATHQGLGSFRLGEGIYTEYGVQDGLWDNLFAVSGSYKANNGELFFGCAGGLVSFYPEDIKIDSVSPIVMINDFSLIDKVISFDRPIEDIEEITLPYSDNSFEIDFVALHYKSPECNQYAYKLEGFDADWTYCGADESFTRYTNIPSGEYNFMVKASNTDGIWNEKGAYLKIIITPPFWQEWWFIVILIAAALLLVIILIRLRTRALNVRAQQLETQVIERTSQLAEKNKQLEKEAQRRIYFTRSLVHELKTPITPLLGASETLASQLKDRKFKGLARNIYKGAYQLNNRINELLDLAKGEVNLLKLNYSKVDMARLLKEAAKYSSAQVSKRGLSLSLDLPDPLPRLSADEERIKQVVTNLLDNAIKFTPEGGEIALKAEENDRNILIEIYNSGPGITRNMQKRLFQPYHRIESDREHLSGLGLGLALCKILVELHGGKIWIKSQKQKGCTFVFSLPLYNGHISQNRDVEADIENTINRRR
ncbi:MAG: ATP-binding protein, partial [Candidatus Bathyarchaeota archaeon]|nr:ATP-binding protein [Candidatus Bathyarchaeota archaeon]